MDKKDRIKIYYGVIDRFIDFKVISTSPQEAYQKIKNLYSHTTVEVYSYDFLR